MTDILAVVETLAREKGIERELVLEAIELGMQKAGRSRYGHEFDIRAVIDRKNGAIRLARYRAVVEEVENEAAEINLEEARAIKPDINLGDDVIEPLPPMEFGRVAALTARQVITQKVREAEREQQYEDFKDKIGQIVNGVVKRKEYGNVIVDLGRAEGFMRRDQTLGRENFERGERIRAYLNDVRRETIYIAQYRDSGMHEMPFVSKLPKTAP